MTEAANMLLQEALQLDLDDRAKLAAKLLASLDSVEDDVGAAWAEEIERRSTVAQDQRGTEWRTVLNKIQSKVLKR